MPTGDGLLARLSPTATLALDDFAELCAAARRFGNGVVEITGRGNIQIRGLRPDTVEAFAHSVAIDGIHDGGIAVLTDPLAGLGRDADPDAPRLAEELRAALAASGLVERLNAKVSVVIDGGTDLHLDAVAADVRLRADRAGGFEVALGGNASSASLIGTVGRADAVALVERLLAVIAARGRTARARQVVQSEGIAAFVAAAGGLVVGAPPLAPRLNKAQPIGQHALRDGSFAVGVGLAFGHAMADALEQLVAAAQDVGASGIRTAPQRCLLVTGVAAERISKLFDAAARLNFVIAAHDPRRHVAACAGAPLCGSGEIVTRALAPAVASAAASLLDGTTTIHLSGCAKGCAHAGAAALTIVGCGRNACRVVWSGTTADAALAELSPDQLLQGLARLGREVACSAMPGESASAALARLGRSRIAAILAGDRP
jgi:precorrin-3B synthase